MSETMFSFVYICVLSHFGALWISAYEGMLYVHEVC